MLANVEAQEGLNILERYSKEFDDDFAQQLFALIKSFIHFGEGEFEEYERIIRDIKCAKKADKYYIFKPLETSLDFDLQHERPSSVQDLFAVRDYRVPTDARMVICASCDEVYFWKYHRFFFDSFRAASIGTKDIYAHVSLLVKSPESPLSPAYEKAMRQENVLFSLVDAHQVRTPGPLASLLRLVDGYHLFEALDCDVISMDFDAFFLNIPDFPDFDFDIGVRELKNSLPWETYAAGFTYFRKNDISKQVLSSIFRFANHYFDASRDQWWIDQNALEAAIRTLRKSGEQFLIADIKRQLQKYIVIPTGGEETKLKLLNSEYKKLPLKFVSSPNDR